MGNQMPNGLENEVIGLVDSKCKFVDSSGLAPDLALESNQGLHHLWVLAVSVFSKKKVLRLIMVPQGLSEHFRWELLHSRTQSPPGKILTGITFSLCQQILDSILPTMLHDVVERAPKTKQRLVQGQMELKGIQRAKAAVTDNAAIELSYWALPNETPIQTKARIVLRNLAHTWWVSNVSREAHEWLARNGLHPKDQVATKDCLRRVAGSDYWDCHRGSHLFFWRFPVECDWRKEARDGTEFFHLTKAPKGLHFQNIPPSSQEAELKICEKVFQLWFCGYLELGNPDLVIPRFAVEKVADDAGKTLDIRAVWDAEQMVSTNQFGYQGLHCLLHRTLKIWL
jgi:hypothetical protein